MRIYCLGLFAESFVGKADAGWRPDVWANVSLVRQASLPIIKLATNIETRLSPFLAAG